MKNLSIPIAIVIAGLIIAGAIIYTKAPQQVSQPTTDKKDHILGDISAPVIIVEFSDFQCPFCAQFHPTVKKILEDYPGKVRLVYKHFPLDQIHPNARPAAEASECVFEQKGNDGFWQFADSLFENQERLDESLYKEVAGQIGLNLEQFNNCFSSRKHKDKVQADYQEGLRAGVQGTPGSFVNGEEIPGAVPYETLKAAVERAIETLE